MNLYKIYIVHNNTYYGVEKICENNPIFNKLVFDMVQSRGYYNVVFKEETLCIIDMSNPINFNKDEYKHILQKVRDNKLDELI